jgi:hypothetical protein
MAKKKKSSITQWETSSFGGYERVLYDYPEISMDWDVKVELREDYEGEIELKSYLLRKLGALCMLRINEVELSSHAKKILIDALLKEAVVVKKNIWWHKKTFLVPTRERMEMLCKWLTAHDTELANMFVNYSSIIHNLKIMIPVPDSTDEEEKTSPEKYQSTKKNKKGENSGKGEEKGEEKGETKKGEGEENKDDKKEGKDSGKGSGPQEEKRDGRKDSSSGSSGSSKKSEQETGGGSPENYGKEEETEDGPSENQLESASRIIQKVRKYDDGMHRYSLGDTLTEGTLKENTRFVVMRKTGRTIYTPEEIAAANALVDLLDINFDPAKDRVTSLRSGKIDMSKLGSVPAGNEHIYYRVEENIATRPFSVCILADGSGSMGTPFKNSETQYPSLVQYHVIKSLYRAFSQILPQDKIYIYDHSGLSTPEIRVYHDPYNLDFEETIDNQFSNRWAQNYDGPVVECIYEKIRGYTSDNIIFVSISDGQPAGNGYGGISAVRELKRILEKCKRDGFCTVGVGIRSNHVRNIYTYNTVVNDISELSRKVSLIINQVVKTEFQ